MFQFLFRKKCRSCGIKVRKIQEDIVSGFKYCGICYPKIIAIKNGSRAFTPQTNQHGKALEVAGEPVVTHVHMVADVPTCQWTKGKIQCGVFAEVTGCLPDDVMYAYARINEEEDFQDHPRLEQIFLEPLDRCDSPITYRLFKGEVPNQPILN